MTYLIWFRLLVSTMQLVHGGWHGTVLFMKAGSNLSLSDVFMMPSFNDDSTEFKHLWNITDLMNGTTDYFRSPLYDRRTELDMTNFDAIAYNAAGEVMTSFSFDMFNDEPVSPEGNMSDPTTGLMLHSAVDANKVRFLAITVNSGEPRGAQFILTSNEDFNDLPMTVSMGCYDFNTSFLFVNVSKTRDIDTADECILHCVTKKNSLYAAIFQMKSHINSVKYRCTCLPSLGTATTSTNNASKCYDDSDCGCSLFTNGDFYIQPSVYSMDHMNSFLLELLSDTQETMDFYIPFDSPYKLLNGRTIISQISINDFPNFTYKLGLSEENNCWQYTTFYYYGRGIGAEQIFNATEVQDIVGTPATCLKMDFQTNPPTSHIGVSLKKQTDTFVAADYLRIVGHWHNRECHSQERLHNSSLIPDLWVRMAQMNKTVDGLDNANIVSFPEMSTGIVNINIAPDSEPYLVLQAIEFSANVDVQIITTIKTNGTCVVLGDGKTSQQLYSNDVIAMVNTSQIYVLPVPTLCVNTISFSINTTAPTGSVTQRVNHMTFGLRGCVIYDFDLSSPCATVNITHTVLALANTSWHWIPHPVRAVSYLRPGGPGLVLYRQAEPYIVIQLDNKWVDIEVTHVFITGDIISADVTIGGVLESVFNHSNTILHYSPVNLRGHEIRIDNIIGRDDMNASHVYYEYLVMHLEIEICVPEFYTTPQNNTNNASVNAMTTSITGTQPAPTSTQVSSTPGSTITHPGTITTSTSTTTHSGSTPTLASTTTQVSTTAPASTSVQPNSTPMHSSSTLSASSSTPPPSTTSPHNTSTHPTSTSTSVTTTTPASSTTTLVSSTSSATITTLGSTTTHASSTTSISSSVSTTTTSSVTPPSTTAALNTPPLNNSSPLTPGSTHTHVPASSSSTPLTTTLSTNNSTGTTASLPPPCCICFSNTVILTKAEVDVIVADIVRNLTVSKRKTSAFKRTLVSAPDERTSAKMVGTVGIAMMTLTGGLIVAMDYSHIINAVKFIKHVFTCVFL